MLSVQWILCEGLSDLPVQGYWMMVFKRIEITVYHTWPEMWLTTFLFHGTILFAFYNVSPLQTFHKPKFQECEDFTFESWRSCDARNGRSGRLERWWCIGIWKSSKIDCTPKSFTSSPTIFHELLKTSALCGSVNGGRHICHNQASAASRHFKKQNVCGGGCFAFQNTHVTFLVWYPVR
jgi:hypothetical protein